MSTVDQAIAGGTPLNAALDAGLDNIRYGQEITFQRYVRRVLPLDGFVFWIKANPQMLKSAAYNVPAYNVVTPNQTGPIDTSKTLMTVQGSLHFTTRLPQNEADSATVNGIIFTSESPVNDLLAVGPNVMWIGTFEGQQFAFKENFKAYKAAGVYHYRGDAVNGPLLAQLIDTPAQLPAGRVVSNSLPVWLSLNKFALVYPSFAIPENLPAPYIACHIRPEGTEALQAIPLVDLTSTSWQLAKDRVKFTLYGLPNNQAIDFLNYLVDQFQDDAFPAGLMSMPILKDDKQTHPEMQILAQRKTLEFEVSYYQTRVQALARQMITSAMVTFTPN